MRKLSTIALSTLVLSLMAACGGGNVAPNTPTEVRVVADFNQSIEGWSGGSSDYTEQDAPKAVIFEQRALAAPLTGKGYYVAGTNQSDDLLLYVKKQFSGMAPSTSYQLTFTVKFASDVSSGCLGVGGSPGESVWMIGAASDVEPKTILKAGRNELNIDRGNQAGGGTAGQALGTLGNSVLNCGPQVNEIKTVKSAVPLVAKSDAAGKIWLLLGMDSGFEAASHVSFTQMTVDAVPVK
jgi:hypothetical protein